MVNDTIENNNVSSIINIKKISYINKDFRREIWTGKYAQVTVMNIEPGGEIGLEFHSDLDQILGVVYGVATVYTGKTKNSVSFDGFANDNSLIVIPSGTYHNVINDRPYPLKLFSFYAPPNHPVNTIHKTKFDSDLAEN